MHRSTWPRSRGVQTDLRAFEPQKEVPQRSASFCASKHLDDQRPASSSNIESDWPDIPAALTGVPSGTSILLQWMQSCTTISSPPRSRSTPSNNPTGAIRKSRLQTLQIGRAIALPYSTVRVPKRRFGDCCGPCRRVDGGTLQCVCWGRANGRK